MNIYNKNDPATIRALFNNIATHYDRTNAILSFRLHKRWNRALIKHALAASQPEAFLDVCCGTGAIAFDYLQDLVHPVKVYMLDFSEGMLAHAREHAHRRGLNRHEIHYLQADAQDIPLPDSSVDCAAMAYGIRNIKQPAQSLTDIYRVLRSGGILGILELTQPANPLLRLGHSLYLRTILPLLGRWCTANQEAYKYLCQSIHTFIPPAKLAKLMSDAGFSQITTYALCCGTATLLIGQK